MLFVPAGIEKMFALMGGKEEEYLQHPEGFIHALNEDGNKFGVYFFEDDE